MNPVNPADFQPYSRPASLPSAADETPLSLLTADPAAVAALTTGVQWFELKLESFGIETLSYRNLPAAEHLSQDERVDKVLSHLHQ